MINAEKDNTSDTTQRYTTQVVPPKDLLPLKILF